MIRLSSAGARLVREATPFSRHQWALRAAVLLAPLLVLACAHGAGARPGGGIWGTIVTVAVLAATRPQSLAPGAAIAAVAGYWAVAVTTPSSPWALVAAALVLILHSASALAALGPPGLRLDDVTLGRWVRRMAAVASLTTLVWIAARLADGRVTSSSVLVSGAALALLAGILLMQRHSAESG